MKNAAMINIYIWMIFSTIHSSSPHRVISSSINPLLKEALNLLFQYLENINSLFMATTHTLLHLPERNRLLEQRKALKAVEDIFHLLLELRAMIRISFSE